MKKLRLVFFVEELNPLSTILGAMARVNLKLPIKYGK
jgi:hypothetical protein